MELIEMREAINKAIDNYLYEREPSSLYEAVRHLPTAGGKRLRPIIACLSCESVGGKFISCIPFGVALEIIHTFTLVHDDIMDKDEQRRGIPAVHKLFGEETAILAGDALFAKAFEIASYTKNDKTTKTILRHLAMMTKEICEGQELDIKYGKEDYITERQFFEVIEKKTAKMFEYAAMGGAIIGGGTKREQEAMRQYGKNLGMAFQIWDDCLDVIGKNIGKPLGSDIKEGKKTLLYICAYQNSEDTKWRKKYGNNKISEAEIQQIINVFEKTDAIAYAKEKAYEFSQSAKKCLELIKPGEAKEKLSEMIDFAVKREK